MVKMLTTQEFIKRRMIQGMLLDENVDFIYIRELLEADQFVNKVYSVILNRPPTTEESNFYEELLKKGVPLQWIIYNIKRSLGDLKDNISIHGLIRPKPLAELLQLEGEKFVQEVYFTLLWREADLQGINNYLAELKSGESKQTIINRIVLSEEGKVIPDNFQFFKLDEQQFAADQSEQLESVKVRLEDELDHSWSSKTLFTFKEYLRKIKKKLVKIWD